MEGDKPKRRRIAAADDDDTSSLRLCDLPIDFLVDTATYLSKPSRALFAIAVSTSSWPLSDTSNEIIASTQWDILDFGELERDFSKQLTDDHVAGILACIDAPTNLRRLKLRGLMNITGSGLEILRGSTVLEQIDLRVDNWNWRLCRLEGGEKISEQVVLPILMSTSIKHIMGMPKPWGKARSNYLQNFAAQYNQFLGIRATPCNTCGGPCRRDATSYSWFGLYSGEYVQKYTCESCLKCICDRGECSLNKCYGCDRKLCEDCKCCQICNRCSDCKSTLQTCVGDGCDRLICNGCNNTTCQNDQCKKTGCEGCLGFKRCGEDSKVEEVEGCEKTWCSSCQTTFRCDHCRRCNECAASPFVPCPVSNCESSGNFCQECIKTCGKCKATGCVKCLDYRVCKGRYHDEDYKASCYNGLNSDGTYKVKNPDCDVDKCDECEKELCTQCWSESWCIGDCNECDIKFAKFTNQWSGCECTPDCRYWDEEDCPNNGKSE